MPFRYNRVFPRTYKGSYNYQLPCRKIKSDYYVMIHDELHKVYAPEPIAGYRIKLHFKDQEPLTFGREELMTIPIIDDASFEVISIDEKNNAHLRDQVNPDEKITVWIDDETPFGADLLEDYKDRTISTCVVRYIRWGVPSSSSRYYEKLQIVQYSLDSKTIEGSFKTDPTMENVNPSWY